MSEKSKTNKKWTSSPDYRDNFDAIFSKKPKLRNECAACGSTNISYTGIRIDAIGLQCNVCKHAWYSPE